MLRPYHYCIHNIAEKFRGRKFRDFVQNQTFCGFNFAISNFRNICLVGKLLSWREFWARNCKIALKWLNPLLHYMAAILLWHLHILNIFNLFQSVRSFVRSFGCAWHIKRAFDWQTWPLCQCACAWQSAPLRHSSRIRLGLQSTKHTCTEAYCYYLVRRSCSGYPYICGYFCFAVWVL